MDLCSLCCSDEADMGVAPFDRVAAHVGLSDDDLLDFESDEADSASLARVVSRSKLHHSKLKGRVSSEVYRLEQKCSRSREESQLLQSRKGSRQSRSGAAGRSGSLRGSPRDLSSVEIASPRRQLSRKSQSRSSQQSSWKPSPPEEHQQQQQQQQQKQQQQEAARTPTRPSVAAAPARANSREQQKQGEHEPSSFRRLSDMSTEEKAREKQRLQALVKEFAREAVAGFQLTLLDIDRGQSVPATFSMDRHLLTVTLDSHDESEVNSASFGVGSLTGVFKAEDFYSDSRMQPSASFDPLQTLVLTTKEPGCSKLVMVLDGRRERDKAYTCMKILRYE
ncbi:hypothetical protein Efla_002776 [Eimeria flavescens]